MQEDIYGRGLDRGQVGERSTVNRRTQQKAREGSGQEDRWGGRLNSGQVGERSTVNRKTE
jgi:hypothetical protein